MNVIDNLAAFYISMFNGGRVSLGFLFTIEVSKEVFLSTYKKFVNDKILIPIEELPEEKKKELIKECRSTGLKFSNQTLTNSARILHTLKFINENS